jgi:hypothetical protein
MDKKIYKNKHINIDTVGTLCDKASTKGPFFLTTAQSFGAEIGAAGIKAAIFRKPSESSRFDFWGNGRISNLISIVSLHE